MSVLACNRGEDTHIPGMTSTNSTQPKGKRLGRSPVTGHFVVRQVNGPRKATLQQIRHAVRTVVDNAGHA